MKTRLPQYVILAWIYINLLLLPVAAVQDSEVVSVKSIKENYLDTGSWGKILPLNSDVLGEVPSEQNNSFLFIFTYISLLALCSQGLFRSKNKKGQITLFMVVGVVLVLSAVGFFYIKDIVVKQKTGEEVIEKIDVPVEVSPIKNFVENCIEQKASKALSLVESQGGYIDTSSFNTYLSTEGNAVDFGGVVPYWFHMKSSNTCTNGCEFPFVIPKLCRAGSSIRQNCITSGEDSIEEDIEDYVTEEIVECIDDGFREFEKRGYDIEELGSLAATATIRNKDIVLTLDYPLKIKKDGTTNEMDTFQRVVLSDLSEMYKMAVEITDYQAQNCLIEEHTKNYISHYYGLDDGDLPPIATMTIGDLVPIYWILFDVENILRVKIAEAMARMMIFNVQGFNWPTTTLDPSDPDYDLAQSTLDNYVFFPLSEYHNKTSINFVYPPFSDSYKPYLDIKPSDGQLLLPTNIVEGPEFDGLAGAIAFIVSSMVGLKEYRYSYQYSFPVVVNIEKTDDRGEDHVFRFALESNTRGNVCFRPGMTLSYTSSTSSMSCDRDFWANNVTLHVTDNSTGDDLKEALVYFNTGPSTCMLGMTDENGTLETDYPLQFGGFFDIKKNGYLKRIVYGENVTHPVFETSLIPMRKMNVGIKLIDDTLRQQLSVTGSTLDILSIKDGAPGPDANDTIIIELTRQPESLEEPEYSTVIIYDDGSLMQETVDLIPGKYNVSITLMRSENLSLKAEHNRMCEGFCCYRVPVNDACTERGGTEEDFETGNCYIEGYTCENGFVAATKFAVDTPPSAADVACEVVGITGLKICMDEDGAEVDDGPGVPFDYPPIDIGIYPNGGVNIVNWDLAQNDLDNSENITLFLFRQRKPTRQHHFFNEMDAYKAYSTALGNKIWPEFS